MTLFCQFCGRTFSRPDNGWWWLPPHQITPDFRNGARCGGRMGIPV